MQTEIEEIKCYPNNLRTYIQDNQQNHSSVQLRDAYRLIPGRTDYVSTFSFIMNTGKNLILANNVVKVSLKKVVWSNIWGRTRGKKVIVANIVWKCSAHYLTWETMSVDTSIDGKHNSFVNFYQTLSVSIMQ